MNISKKIETCECTIIHKDVVDKVKNKMLEDSDYMLMADFYKAFADTTRNKILSALYHSEMCVCDLVYLLGMTQPAISHHLKLLKSMRLIKYRKAGKFVYYSLDDQHISEIIKSGIEHIRK